ncbi:MAG: hypothetical protein HOP33_11265 [Verrucomicrobia bacterium]|nr:hypothetical protein [Verrucomicrobiota bacterium]
MKRIKLITAAAAVALLCALPQATLATLVTLPNPTATGGLDISASSATVVGTFVTSVFDSFVAPPDASDFSGTLLSEVYDTGSGYTFVYTLTRTAGPDQIGRFTVDGWLPSQTLMVGNLTGSANFAQSADRKAGSGGKVVGFNYDTGLPGVSILVIATDTKTWAYTSAGIQNGSGTSATTLAAVPEPTTVIAGALLLLPFGASTVRFIRRNRATV